MMAAGTADGAHRAQGEQEWRVRRAVPPQVVALAAWVGWPGGCHQGLTRTWMNRAQAMVTHTQQSFW